MRWLRIVRVRGSYSYHCCRRRLAERPRPMASTPRSMTTSRTRKLRSLPSCGPVRRSSGINAARESRTSCGIREKSERGIARRHQHAAPNWHGPWKVSRFGGRKNGVGRNKPASVPVCISGPFTAWRARRFPGERGCRCQSMENQHGPKHPTS